MTDKFKFEQWCKDYSLPTETVTLLTTEHFTELPLILAIDWGWITELDEVPQGEKMRLKLAIDSLKTPVTTDAVGGAVGGQIGAVGGIGGFPATFDGTRPKIKIEPEPGPARPG